MGKLIKRLAVGLDLTEMDKTVIKFAEFVATRNKSSEVYFIHIVRPDDFPEELKSQFPGIDDKIISEREKAIKENIEKYWDKSVSTKHIILVKQGKIARNLLKILDANDMDLVIIGKSVSSKERGMLAQKIARLANCQLLIVPEGCTPRFQKIHVPINHSDNDKIALEKAIDIIRISETRGEIICQNIYNVPSGYHYTGKSYEEFAEVMREHTEKKFEKLLAQLDSKDVTITPVFSLDREDDPIEVVYKLALEEKPDTILLGAKGLSTATALFLSSIAEKLIQIDTQFPIRIVREKGDNAGILEFIKKI